MNSNARAVAARRHEPQHRHDAQAEPRERGLDREVRPVRGDRILEKHVEQRLVPDELSVSSGSGGPRHVREGRVVRRERPIGGQRDADAGDAGAAEPRVAFEAARLPAIQSVAASRSSGSRRCEVQKARAA